MGAVLGGVWIIILLAFAIAQFCIGYIGIEHHFGLILATIALLLAWLRFTLPITIGAFFGAMDVLHWHWALAALFAAPGLILIIPGMLAVIIAAVKSKVGTK